MERLLEQVISNHPIFKEIERKVVVYSVNIDGRHDQIVLDAEIRYSNEKGEDVTGAFKSKIEGWIVNNNDMTTVRDKLGNAVVNENYREASEEGEDDRSPEEKERYKKIPSFDYFFQIIKSPKSPNLINLLAMHIDQNDRIGFFDELLNVPSTH